MRVDDFLDTLTEVPVGNLPACDLAAVVSSGADCRAYLAGPAGMERIQILYLPEEGRAGIAFGADADWTDCEDARDALERYLGVNGKEMRE